MWIHIQIKIKIKNNNNNNNNNHARTLKHNYLSRPKLMSSCKYANIISGNTTPTLPLNNFNFAKHTVVGIDLHESLLKTYLFFSFQASLSFQICHYLLHRKYWETESESKRKGKQQTQPRHFPTVTWFKLWALFTPNSCRFRK